MSEHTQKPEYGEPWTADGLYLGAQGGYICYCEDGDPEYLRRIVACVNACKGIPNEELETGKCDKWGGPSLISRIATEVHERDELRLMVSEFVAKIKEITENEDVSFFYSAIEGDHNSPDLKKWGNDLRELVIKAEALK